MSGVGSKRKADSGALVVASKKQKSANGSIVTHKGSAGAIISSGMRRTSNLEAPIMQLGNHEGEIYATKFHPNGRSLASGSFDKNIYFWDVYGECENYNVLRGHKNAVLDLQYSEDGLMLYTASADRSCVMWDLQANCLSRRFREHSSIVNACHPARRGPPLTATCSDDSTAKVWDTRTKNSTLTIKHNCPVTCVTFSDNAAKLFTSGIDNNIYCWDLANEELEYKLTGHRETVTGLSLSPDGNFLLSNSMDNTVRMWDVRPFVSQEATKGRQVKEFTGVLHNYESNLLKCSWSPDSKRIAAGSADKFVYIWDAVTGSLAYKLPGHKGSVNEVAFHPNEPIIASCSSDRTIFLGEINESAQ